MSLITELKEISIDLIIEPGEQVRTVIVMEGLQELADSIRQRGIINPLIVIEREGKFEICDGHRRFLAAKIAGQLLVPCIVRALDEKDSDIVKLHANYFREDVNPVDEGKYFMRLHEKYVLGFGEIAKLCGRSESYVLSRVRLLTADPRVLAALEAGQIGISQAIVIAGALDENVRLELLRVTIESGATVEALRIMRHDYERCIRDKDVSVQDESKAPESYVTAQHLIQCPVCQGAYPVREMYPIHTCKTCYDGFMAGLKEGKNG